MPRSLSLRAFARSVVLAVTSTGALIAQDGSNKSLADLKVEGAARSSYRLLGAHAIDGSLTETEPASFPGEIEPILAGTCYGCHGPDKQKGGFRVDELDPDLFGGGDVESWLEVLAVLNNGEMPPSDAADVHLRDDDRRKVVDWLVAESQRASRLRRGNATPPSLRRLARYEFAYVLEDLLALPLDLADELPPDPVSHDGFENSSEVLQVSGVQFRAWYDAARKSLELATVSGVQPNPLHWSVSMRMLAAREWQKQDAELEAARAKHAADAAQLAQAVEELTKRHRRRAGGLHFLDTSTGRRAGQSWAYDGARHAIAPTESSDETRDGLPAPEGDAPVAILPSRAALTIELGDRIPERGNLRVRVRAWRGEGRDGAIPSLGLHFGWQASNDSRADFAVGSTQLVDTGADAPRIYQWEVPIHTLYPRNAVRGVTKLGDLPSPSELIRIVNETRTECEVIVDHVDVLAPVFESWPPASHGAVFGSVTDSSGELLGESARVREVLQRFLPRAWRRVVSDDEVARKVRLFERHREGSDGFEVAMVQTLATVLSSPDAVFVGPQLATRLSLFLWCSAPDEELLTLAESQTLAEPAVLKSQVDRMLADPRSARFPAEFVRQWLNLELLDFLNVDHKLYPDFDEDLRQAMREEPIAFFAEVLRRDLSVLEFLHSDFALVNERLASHYGIGDVTGSRFRQVALAAELPRGGLLTQAGLLAMNSDGKDSHPLKRGIWLLERLLDDPPPPPPAAVPQIDLADPAIAKMTLKQRLENHRNAAACMSCHARIDPWGIAFENFDAVGRWRAEIRGQPVDAVAQLFNQQTLDGADGLKRFLLQHRQDQFVRALVKKLLIFALGRPLTFADRAAVDKITADVRRDGDGLRSIVHRIVASELFQNR